MSTVAKWGAPGGALQGIKLADVVHPIPFDGLCKLSGRVVAVHRWLNGPAKFENSEAGHLCDGTSDCRPLMEVQAAGVPKQVGLMKPHPSQSCRCILLQSLAEKIISVVLPQILKMDAVRMTSSCCCMAHACVMIFKSL